MSIGVIEVTQACSEPVLQSSIKQWEMQFALTIVAVHWCWVTAHLYEQQRALSLSMDHLCLTCCRRWDRQQGCKAMLYLAKMHDTVGPIGTGRTSNMCELQH